MTVTEIFSFAFASLILAFTPGPDILFVIVTSLSKGFRAALKFTLGLSSGIIIHTLLVAVGVSALISQSQYGLITLQYFAAAYLLWLAYKTFMHRHDPIHLEKNRKVENYYIRGFIMNVSNPKVMLFFLAFFPRFANLSEDGYQYRLVFLGLIFMAVTFAAFFVTAWLCSKGREKIIENEKVTLIINWFAVLVFVSISALLLLDNFSSD